MGIPTRQLSEIDDIWGGGSWFPTVQQNTVVQPLLPSGDAKMLQTGDILPTGVTYTGPSSSNITMSDGIYQPPVGQSSGWLSDIMGGLFGGLIPSPTPSTSLFGGGGLGLNLPTLALAYGAYSVLLKKKKGLLPLGALLYGLMCTGILQSIFPQESGTSLAVKTAAIGFLPTGIGSALALGLGPAAIMTMGNLLKGSGRKRKSWRSKRYGGNRYYSRRNYYYSRRRY